MYSSSSKLCSQLSHSSFSFVNGLPFPSFTFPWFILCLFYTLLTSFQNSILLFLKMSPCFFPLRLFNCLTLTYQYNLLCFCHCTLLRFAGVSVFVPEPRLKEPFIFHDRALNLSSQILNSLLIPSKLDLFIPCSLYVHFSISSLDTFHSISSPLLSTVEANPLQIIFTSRDWAPLIGQQVSFTT